MAPAPKFPAKSRLILDPARAPVIAQMFTWRTVGTLGCPAIAARLNADPAAYPPPNPTTGWTAHNVRVMLANPKYTGHMVGTPPATAAWSIPGFMHTWFCVTQLRRVALL